MRKANAVCSPVRNFSVHSRAGRLVKPVRVDRLTANIVDWYNPKESQEQNRLQILEPSNPPMKIAFFELEEWEKDKLRNRLLEGHVVHLPSKSPRASVCGCRSSEPRRTSVRYHKLDGKSATVMSVNEGKQRTPTFNVEGRIFHCSHFDAEKLARELGLPVGAN